MVTCFGDRVLAAQAQRFPPGGAARRHRGPLRRRRVRRPVRRPRLAARGAAVAERIVSDLVAPATRSMALTIGLHASIGVVTTNDPSADVTTLLEQADHAMYRAKQRGRDCVELASSPDAMRGPVRLRTDSSISKLERQRDWRPSSCRIHHQLRDAEAALGRLWADEVPVRTRQAAHRLADAARACQPRRPIIVRRRHRHRVASCVLGGRAVEARRALLRVTGEPFAGVGAAEAVELVRQRRVEDGRTGRGTSC